MAFETPPLPYPYESLERAIDAETMHVHHDKHHAAYTTNFNAALADYPDLQAKSAVEIIRSLDQVPEAIRGAVRNHGGGHLNHALFWETMSPDGGGEPTGPIAEAIVRDFGSFEALKEQFNDAGMKRFGSGWAWLVKDGGTLKVLSTANQDSPLSEGKTPILMNDVWEHAYYLRYKNLRADYLKAWWTVVNWEVANERYAG